MGDASALSSRFEYLELSVDSRGTRYSSNGGSDSSDWPLLFFTQQNFLPAGIQVLEAEIPFVFDTISTSNNTFTVNYGGPNISVVLDPGTYNAEELRVEVLSKLNATLAGWAVTWNSFSSTYTFTAVSPFTFTFTTNSPFINLGFTPGSFASTGNTLVSSGAASPTGPFYLYLNSQSIGPTINNYIQDGDTSRNQICRIPINVEKGKVIFYKTPNPNQYYDFLPGSNFNNFDLYLTLGYAQSQVPLKLKGLGFSVKIGLLNYRSGGIPIGAVPATGRGPSSFLVP